MRITSAYLRPILISLFLGLLCSLGVRGESAAAAPVVPVALAPTVEQRLASLEAYLANTDPTAALKNARGEIPPGLTTPSAGVAGPGHNAWMMVSAALVLFMTLPGLALLRRTGAGEKCAVDHGLVPGHHECGHGAVVGRGIQFGFWQKL